MILIFSQQCFWDSWILVYCWWFNSYFTFYCKERKNPTFLQSLVFIDAYWKMFEPWRLLSNFSSEQRASSLFTSCLWKNDCISRSKYARILIWLDSEYAKVTQDCIMNIICLNISGFTVIGSVLNIPGFWICLIINIARLLHKYRWVP